MFVGILVFRQSVGTMSMKIIENDYFLIFVSYEYIRRMVIKVKRFIIFQFIFLSGLVMMSILSIAVDNSNWLQVLLNKPVVIEISTWQKHKNKKHHKLVISFFDFFFCWNVILNASKLNIHFFKSPSYFNLKWEYY